LTPYSIAPGSEASTDDERDVRSRRRVLMWLTDDSEGASEPIAGLQNRGWRVLVAGHGDDGLALAKRNGAAVIAIEQRAGCSGLDLLERVCNVKFATPIVFLSGTPDHKVAFKVGRLGAAGFHSRPHGGLALALETISSDTSSNRSEPVPDPGVARRIRPSPVDAALAEVSHCESLQGSSSALHTDLSRILLKELFVPGIDLMSFVTVARALRCCDSSAQCVVRVRRVLEAHASFASIGPDARAVIPNVYWIADRTSRI
jgi:ActR/RegA family two-component response regulator